MPLCLAAVPVGSLLLEDSRCVPVELADRVECGVETACATLCWVTAGASRRSDAGFVCAAACVKSDSFTDPSFALRISITELFGDAAWEGVGAAVSLSLLFKLAPAAPSSHEWLSTVVAMRNQSSALR